MDCSMPGFPGLHYLPEFAQTHIHWVGDAIQPSHPLSPRFSSSPQSFPASGPFSVSWLLASGGQSTLFLLFPILYTISAWLTYFIIGNLYHFIPSTNFPYLHRSLPFSNYSSLYLSLFPFYFVCLFCLLILHISDIIWRLSLSVWLLHST